MNPNQTGSLRAGVSGGRGAVWCRRVLHRFVAFVTLLVFLLASVPATPLHAGEIRSLKIYFVHTGERANIIFKRDGRYDTAGLMALNRLLRDWRRNEPTRMDPRLWDLVWEVYRAVGGQDYIYAVSGYRSPQTNAMLRQRTRGVARHSQHMLGKAMDFYIPGVPLKRLRETAMRYQRGGVGFYPTANSPFVHLDVGGVRSWPRMNRNELVRLFPDGKTMHIPADGTPLPGYQQALAEYRRNGGTDVLTANAAPSRGVAMMSTMFGADDGEDGIAARPTTSTRLASQTRTAQRNEAVVQTIALPPQQPRSTFSGQIAGNGLALALYSRGHNPGQDAIAAAMSDEDGEGGAAGKGGIPVPLDRPTTELAMASADDDGGDEGDDGTDGEGEAEEDAADQVSLSEDSRTALEKAASAIVIASRVPVPGPVAPTQPNTGPFSTGHSTAAIDSAAGRFGDMFDVPRPPLAGNAPPVAVRVPRAHLSSGTAELNGVRLAQWAFAVPRKSEGGAPFTLSQAATHLMGEQEANPPALVAGDQISDGAGVLPAYKP